MNPNLNLNEFETSQVENSEANPSAETSDRPKEWWEDENIPLDHKPNMADLWCFGLFMITSAYNLLMLFLRPLLFGIAPKVLACLGSFTAVILTGSLASIGDHWWPLVWILASFGNIKFDLIYWWAGNLWGYNLLEIWSGKSERAKKRNAKAVKIAQKYALLGIALSYVPLLPFPRPAVAVAIGAAKVKGRKFIICDWIMSILFTGFYLGIGYIVGPIAIEFLELYTKWLTWIMLAVVVIFVGYFMYAQSAKQKNN